MLLFHPLSCLHVSPSLSVARECNINLWDCLLRKQRERIAKAELKVNGTSGSRREPKHVIADCRQEIFRNWVRSLQCEADSDLAGRSCQAIHLELSGEHRSKIHFHSQRNFYWLIFLFFPFTVDWIFFNSLLSFPRHLATRSSNLITTVPPHLSSRTGWRQINPLSLRFTDRTSFTIFFLFCVFFCVKTRLSLCFVLAAGMNELKAQISISNRHLDLLLSRFKCSRLEVTILTEKPKIFLSHNISCLWDLYWDWRNFLFASGACANPSMVAISAGFA